LTDERKSLPERMLESGFADLIPVIPPGATMAPSSKITQESVGKIPGRRLENGMWVGYNWHEGTADLRTVRSWMLWGANIGLRTDVYPCIDIDCADAALALTIEQTALATLGPAPIRTGNAPKRALAYRLGEGGQPFGRLRLWIKQEDRKYLVEILAAGQQYVVYGTHPKTGRPYEWDREPTAGDLSRIDLAMSKTFLMAVIDTAEMMGYECELEGDGRGLASRAGDQEGLLAPSMDDLRNVIDLLPNDETVAASRNDWLRIGAAIKAAAGEAEEREAADLFVVWSMKWEGKNEPDDARENFRRLKAPFSVGWPLLAELAREYGFDDSPFEADEPTPTAQEAAVGAKFLSDQWLASKVVKAARGVLRFLPAKEQWLVWNKGRWQPDAEMMAEDLIKLELRKIAAWVDGGGASKTEVAKADKESRDICSSGKLTAVMRLVKSDRAIAVAVESLDHDPWILNTPGGVVDLKTGNMKQADPDQLCTRSTSVTPVYEPAPLWQRFLADATNGDVALQGYLQRLAGYCLTGSTREHKFAFVYGLGGNGKGTFMNAIMGIMAGYHRDSPMETFVASNNDRHPTELAALAGARLVTATETQAGKRWDESKLKRLTGGDPITARAMREDFFTYRPQFKLVFQGNQKPEIRDMDLAMKRRTHLVPFTHQPPKIDMQLGEKLEQEFPQILAWMIEGCLEWQKIGLVAPALVEAATEEYFAENDPIGSWLAECTTAGSSNTRSLDLFGSWKEWANQRNYYVGHIARFTSMMQARGIVKRQHPLTRRAEFVGITLNVEDNLEGLVAE
jgi:putative DNA primase/helicase